MKHTSYNVPSPTYLGTKLPSPGSELITKDCKPNTYCRC